MIDGKRIAVVVPAYNAEQTLEKTVRELWIRPALLRSVTTGTDVNWK